MKKPAIFCVFLWATLLFCFADLSAQTDTIATGDNLHFSNIPAKGLFRLRGGPVHFKENTIGIMPEIRGFRNKMFGLGIARGNFSFAEGFVVGRMVAISAHCDPFDKVWALEAGGSIHIFAYFLGGNFGARAATYFFDGKTSFALRPEIGLGFQRLYLNYGFNFFLNRTDQSTGRHVRSLSAYLPVYQGRRDIVLFDED